MTILEEPMSKTLSQLLKENTFETDPSDFTEADVDYVGADETPVSAIQNRPELDPMAPYQTVTLQPEDPNTQIEVPGMVIMPLSFIVNKIKELTIEINKHVDTGMAGDKGSWSFLNDIMKNKVFASYIEGLANHYDLKKKDVAPNPTAQVEIKPVQ